MNIILYKFLLELLLIFLYLFYTFLFNKNKFFIISFILITIVIFINSEYFYLDVILTIMLKLLYICFLILGLAMFVLKMVDIDRRGRINWREKFPGLTSRKSIKIIFKLIRIDLNEKYNDTNK